LSGGLVLQHQRHVQVRNENTALSAAAAEIERLEAELAREEPAPQVAAEIAQLREQTRELLKLRNEVSRLRRLKADLEAEKREHARLVALQPQEGEKAKPGYEQPIKLEKTAFADQGLLTPEATLQTFLWAMREWDTNRLVHCVVLGQRKAFHERLPRSPREEARKRQLFYTLSVELVARREVSPDTVQIGIIVEWLGDRAPLTFRLEEQEWRLDAARIPLAFQ